MFRFRSRWTALALATSPGFGAAGNDPSMAISAGEEIAGENCADPNM
jgi:hypothetical protein